VSETGVAVQPPTLEREEAKADNRWWVLAVVGLAQLSNVVV
jgi:hypothetical protein